MRQQLDDFDESSMVRIEAIIQSMTPLERKTPKVLNGSRRSRIARGSGTSVSEVNDLMKRFEQSSKMMRQVARGGMPSMPGMPSSGGGRATAAKQAKKNAKKGKKFSGNPAKRGIEAPAQSAPSGSSFGGGAFGGGAGGGQPSAEELEKLQKYLRK
jgi:signal recognition particle subunit SRP54